MCEGNFHIPSVGIIVTCKEQGHGNTVCGKCYKPMISRGGIAEKD